jgi:adenylate cyclase
MTHVPVDAPATGSRQTEIVAVFGDLRNFTAFASKAEPKEVIDLLGAYYATVGAIVDDYQATLTSLSGDGLMILVNAPEPCRRPALRAVRMAMAMQAALQSLALGWRARHYPIGYGIGLAKGPATVGRFGCERRLDYTAVGNVVNLASRLCSAAVDGQILVDAVAAAEIDGRIPLDDLGTRPLKGFDEEIRVFAIAARAAVDSNATRPQRRGPGTIRNATPG